MVFVTWGKMKVCDWWLYALGSFLKWPSLRFTWWTSVPFTNILEKTQSNGNCLRYFHTFPIPCLLSSQAPAVTSTNWPVSCGSPPLTRVDWLAHIDLIQISQYDPTFPGFEIIYSGGRNVNWCRHVKNSRVSSKPEIKLLYNPSVQFLGISQKEMNSVYIRDT